MHAEGAANRPICFLTLYMTTGFALTLEGIGAYGVKYLNGTTDHQVTKIFEHSFAFQSWT